MRYDCQIPLFGEGQEKIQSATVAIVGMGALGSHLADILCRAGVGTLKLIDFDVVDEKNLHRQLYCEADIATLKVVAAKKRLAAINSDVTLESFPAKLDEIKLELLDGADIVADCSDNLDVRHVIDAYCNEHGMAWVHSAAVKDVGTILSVPKGSDSWKIFLSKTNPDSCQSAGILPNLPPLVASIQASEIFKLILGRKPEKRMIRVNAWTHHVDFLKIS